MLARSLPLLPCIFSQRQGHPRPAALTSRGSSSILPSGVPTADFSLGSGPLSHLRSDVLETPPPHESLTAPSTHSRALLRLPSRPHAPPIFPSWGPFPSTKPPCLTPPRRVPDVRLQPHRSALFWKEGSVLCAGACRQPQGPAHGSLAGDSTWRCF